MTERGTIVDRVATDLSLAILDGTHPVGSRLPSVRALADAHDVNVSTIQRVLTRLEERRLVRTHDRSGVEVCDPLRHGGASLWPLVLELARTDPAPALRLLRDALSVRRMLAHEVLRGVAALPRERYAAGLQSAIDALAEEVARPEPTHERLLETDCEILRVLLVAAQRPAILGFFNDVQSMIAATPTLVESLYGDPQLVLQSWRAVAVLLTSGRVDAPALAIVQATLERIDEQILSSFAQRIGARP